MEQGMKKMKITKTLVTLSVLTALPFTAAAQVSPFVSAKVDDAARPCIELAGATAGLPDTQAKAVASAAIEPCINAVKALVVFQNANSSDMNADELSYLYYVAGNIIWMTAASETMKNNGQLNTMICRQVFAAERAWDKVEVPLGSQIDIEMRTNTLRAMLSPSCQQAQ